MYGCDFSVSTENPSAFKVQPTLIPDYYQQYLGYKLIFELDSNVACGNYKISIKRDCEDDCYGEDYVFWVKL